jgi:hypothetical protein
VSCRSRRAERSSIVLMFEYEYESDNEAEDGHEHLSRRSAPLVLVLVLVLGASMARLALAQEPPPATAEAPTSTAAPAPVADYPDVATYFGHEDELIARATGARTTLTAELDNAQKAGRKDEVDRLKRRDDELERAVAALRGIAGFAAELKDLASWREKLDDEARKLSTYDEQLRKARVDPHPAIGAADRVLAEQEIERLTRERETLKARLRTVPRLVDEKKAERAKDLDAFAAIDPDARRGSPEAARRWALKITLAYLDRFIPFLVERQEVWERRLALNAQETDYWDARLRFVDSVMTGRHAARVAIYQRLEAIGGALDEKARRSATLPTGSPEQQALLAEMKELGHQKFLAKQEFDTLEEQERLEASAREKQALEERLAAARPSGAGASDPEELRAAVARAQKEALDQRAAATRETAELEAERKRFEDEVAAATAELARIEAEARGARTAADDARAAALRERLAALRAEEAKALEARGRLVAAAEEKAALAARLVEQRTAELDDAEEKRSLFSRQDQKVSLAALEEAARRVPDDARAFASALGDALRDGDPWRAALVALAAIVAAVVWVKLGRAIRRIGARDG